MRHFVSKIGISFFFLTWPLVFHPKLQCPSMQKLGISVTDTQIFHTNVSLGKQRLNPQTLRSRLCGSICISIPNITILCTFVYFVHERKMNCLFALPWMFLIIDTLFKHIIEQTQERTSWTGSRDSHRSVARIAVLLIRVAGRKAGQPSSVTLRPLSS